MKRLCQTQQTETRVLARPNTPKSGIGQTKQTETRVLARPNRPKSGIGQTKQTEIWVLARPNRPKQGYWPDRTDRNQGIGQTKQTEIRVLARPNRPKFGSWPDRTDRNCHWPDGRRDPNFFQTIGGGRTAPPPVRDPSRSGQFLSWVAYFILGIAPCN